MKTVLRWTFVAGLLALAPVARAEPQLNAAQFAGMLADDDQTEIELARRVAEKTQNNELRSYAQQLASDHQRALDQLREVADKSDIDLGAFKKSELPKADQQLDQSLETMRQAILGANGREADQLFLGYSLLEHDHDLQTLTDAQRRFQGTALGGLVTRTLPMIREHRARAYALLRQSAPQRQARRP